MRLNQVTLPVTDMQAACRFYLTLGFEQIVDTPHYARFYCADGGATFSLSLVNEPVTNPTVIYFEHDDLDDWCSQLMQQGIEFEQPPTDERYLWREAVVRDPSGNTIKLYQAGENRINPPWRVSIKN